MDREKLINYIDDQIPHLNKHDLIQIAHIVDPVVDAKSKIDKDEGLYIPYSTIDTDTLQRIYEFIATKLKSVNIE